jgi:hypothetical protein
MSIGQMYGLAVQRQVERTKPEGERTRDATDATRMVDSALERITAFIPADVIGLYVSGIAIFSPLSAVGKWWIFFVCLAFIPVVMLISYLQRKKRGLPTPQYKVLLLLLVFAGVGFATWAAAMPETPFLSLHTAANKIGGFLVIPLAFVMYGIADICDALPKAS